MVVVEIFGRHSTGKTHFAVSFPEPLVLDFTKNRECMFEVLKAFGNMDRYYFCSDKTIDEVLGKIDRLDVVKTPFRTIVIENSMFMRDAFGDRWCKQEGKKSVYPVERYKEVNDSMDREFILKYHQKYNLVFVSPMSKERIGGDETGRWEWRGYSRLDYFSDMRFMCNTNTHQTEVVKNRFLDSLGEDWVEEVYNEWSEARKLIPSEYRDMFVR